MARIDYHYYDADGTQRTVYKPDSLNEQLGLPTVTPAIKIPNATFLCPKCGRNVLYRRGQFFNWLTIGCGERACPAKKVMKQDNRLYLYSYLTLIALLVAAGLFLTYGVDWQQLNKGGCVMGGTVCRGAVIQTPNGFQPAPPQTVTKPPQAATRLQGTPCMNPNGLPGHLQPMGARFVCVPESNRGVRW